MTCYGAGAFAFPLYRRLEVWRMMRWQPDYRPLKKWAHVLYSATPNVASGKKAVAAIAQQLAVDLWRIFTVQAKAETFGLIYLP